MDFGHGVGLLIALGLASSGCADDSASEDGAAGTGSVDTTAGTGEADGASGTETGAEDGASSTGDPETTAGTTMGGDDDDDDSVPTDEPAPDPWSGGGGDTQLEVSGPGPWPDAPAATFEWSNAWGPNDSPGTICRFNYAASGTYEIESSFGFAFKGLGEGGALTISLTDFTGGGTYEVPDGEVSFSWEFDDTDKPEMIAASVATTAGGSCTVTVDDLWWTGSIECTGLAVEGKPLNAGRVGPIDLSGSWTCLGIPY